MNMNWKWLLFAFVLLCVENSCAFYLIWIAICSIRDCNTCCTIRYFTRTVQNWYDFVRWHYTTSLLLCAFACSLLKLAAVCNTFINAEKWCTWIKYRVERPIHLLVSLYYDNNSIKIYFTLDFCFFFSIRGLLFLLLFRPILLSQPNTRRFLFRIASLISFLFAQNYKCIQYTFALHKLHAVISKNKILCFVDSRAVVEWENEINVDTLQNQITVVYNVLCVHCTLVSYRLLFFFYLFCTYVSWHAKPAPSLLLLSRNKCSCRYM